MSNPFMQIEANSAVEHDPCNDGDCGECNPLTEEDVICNRCGEHSEMREKTGTECCGAGSRF